MPEWLTVNFTIVVVYGVTHSLLTTPVFVMAYNRILPDYTWNIVYSAISIALLIWGFILWEPSNVYLYHFVPGSFTYHLFSIILAFSFFMFFYCFKYTTSFWQWLGVKQVVFKIMGRPMPTYFRVRKNGIKRYIRFPHHTCLIVLFWSHPVMTLDTLFLAIAATCYLYLGTCHQDFRGLRMIGGEWAKYQEKTCLLIPGPRIIKLMISDTFSDQGDEKSEKTAIALTNSFQEQDNYYN